MDGKVEVNGRAVADPGMKIASSDKVLVNGQPLAAKRKRYILLNKPRGCVTTRKDERGRPTVYEYLKDVEGWVFPVGRLDRESEGLLIFTNDTKYGNRLTDPRYNVERTYLVRVSGEATAVDIRKMLSGINIGHGETARPLSVRIIAADNVSSLLEIILNEGKNREIRRMLDAIGVDVTMLKRTRYGPFRLGNLKPGKWAEVKLPKSGGLEK